MLFFFFFSSRRRHTRSDRDWSSDVCSSDLYVAASYAEDAKAVAAGDPLEALKKSKSKALQLTFLRDIPADKMRGAFIDRKSTRLNSSHDQISYAVFCLKKKKKKERKK